MRYFQIKPGPYESTRLALDAQQHTPPGETIYEPLRTAPRTSSGDALLGIRDEHCQLPWIADALAVVLTSGDGVEISEADYVASLPVPALFG